MRRVRALAVLSATAILLAGCSSSGDDDAVSEPTSAAGLPAKELPWERPDDQQARVETAGMHLSAEEALAVHYHAHIDVFVDGELVELPANLGINVGPDSQAPEHGEPGVAPLHTHEASGIVHIEAPEEARFTLGQVFVLWDVRLSARQVGAYRPVLVYVNGERRTGDPNDIVLAAHQEIAVVVGTGRVDVPASYEFPPGL
jgi:hypothetical protein